jgi:hypothetical protein
LEVTFEGFGVEKVLRVASSATFLDVEASCEEPDGGDDDRLELLTDGALVVGAGAQLLADVFDDLVHDRVDLGPLDRLGVL